MNPEYAPGASFEVLRIRVFKTHIGFVIIAVNVPAANAELR
jgi:hypothetical protein